MNAKLKGTIFGVTSAVSYGTNPLGALSLYQQGLNANSVLFYRFSIAAVILASLMLIQKKSFSITRRELTVISTLGVLFGISSLSLFTSFNFMDAGVASTILFIYPVMVAIIMAVFFKERLSFVTILSISMALAGIALLYRGDGKSSLSVIGVLLVIMSSLSYAVYIVVVNKSSIIMSSIKLTFWVLLFCILTIITHSLSNKDYHIMPLTNSTMWLWAIMLALIPTIVSLITMVKAVQLIGSTPTAIMGALEPLTAVALGIIVFGEIFTLHLGMGILMILSAVVLIIGEKSAKPKILVSKISSKGLLLKKYFKWK